MDMAGHKCDICGEVIERDYYRNGKKLCGKDACWKASFWKTKVAWMEDGDRNEDGICVRINGNHWLIDQQTGVLDRGCGGREFFIEFTLGPWAGKVFRSTNLWHQGEIMYFKDQLPDNAIWRTREELKGLAVYQFNGWDAYGEPKYIPCVLE